MVYLDMVIYTLLVLATTESEYGNSLYCMLYRHTVPSPTSGREDATGLPLLPGMLLEVSSVPTHHHALLSVRREHLGLRLDVGLLPAHLLLLLLRPRLLLLLLLWHHPSRSSSPSGRGGLEERVGTVADTATRHHLLLLSTRGRSEERVVIVTLLLW